MLGRQPQKSFRSGYLCTKSNQGEFGMLYHITMKQHSIPQSQLLRCEFQKDCNSILLSDMKKNLLRLNLNNLNYTSILAGKVSFFEFYNYSHEKIYAVSSENQSKLYLVNTINKKWQKFNLNINKVVAFQINILRNLILVCDPVILMLIDQRTKADSKMYKPQKSRILKCIFTANNRSVLVLSEDMNLKQLNIHNMAQQFSIFMPFDLECINMTIRGDNQYLFVYGTKSHAFLITNISEGNPVVSILNLPTNIKYAKFDLQGNLLVLGKDQILYYLIVETMKFVRLFNYENHHVIHSFDISLDNQLVCCISNFGSILVYNFKQILMLLRQKPGLFEEDTVKVSQNISNYQEEIIKEDKALQNKNSFQHLAQMVPSQSFFYPKEQEQDIQLPQQIPIEIRQSFHALRRKVQSDNFFKQNTEQIIQTIFAFKKLLRFDSNSITLFFIRWAIKSQEIVKDLSLMLCPEVVTIIQNRYNLDFEDFVLKSSCSIFLDYFDEDQWLSIVQFLLKNKQKPQNLVVFFLCLLKTIYSSIQKCPTLETFQALLKSNKNINISKLFQYTLQVSSNPRYINLFNIINQSVPKSNSHFGQAQQQQPLPERHSSSTQKMRKLLQRQQQLQSSLNSLHSRKQKLINSN